MPPARDWVKEMVPALQHALFKFGIGQYPSTPNLFGLVQFGKWSVKTGHLSQILTLGDGKIMYPLSKFEGVMQLLRKDLQGIMEDGYQAIHHALKNIQLRNADNIGRMLILITNEERDEAPDAKELSRERIKSFLFENDFVLHVIVNNRFFAGGHLAFGVNSSMWAFVENYLRGINQLPGAHFGPAYYTTQRDYTELALELNGTAWDESLIHKGSLERGSFTVMFTEVVANQSNHLSKTSQQCRPRTKVSTPIY